MKWIKSLSWIGFITLLFTYEEDVRINYLQGLDKYVYAPHLGQLLIEVLSWGVLYIPALIVLGYVCFRKE